ncbi:glycoside hydrolase [Trichodelitschia bisporula]|uniref:Glycoside hydrolase n=1 Tax=Trichodelitschia bisporula TaxID=703511 RepID=A0A6G1I357_9PEZI|nr:glycoside hydrolase [Trichodelitschia bisporula]
MNLYLPERIVAWPPKPASPPPQPANMYAKLTSNPPLDVATVVAPDAGSIPFAVVLETDVASGAEWQVALWHNLGGVDNWASTELVPAGEAAELLEVHQLAAPHLHRRVFILDFPVSEATNPAAAFTYKFRPRTDGDWKWAKDTLGLGDGLLYLQPALFSEHPLSYYIAGLSEAWAVQGENADTPDTQLWSLTAPLAPANGDDSAWAKTVLGVPEMCSRWMAIVRLWTPWLAPRHGRDKFEVDHEAIMAAFLRRDGLSVVVLALSGVDDVLSTLVHDGDGNVVVNSRNDDEGEGTARVLVAVAKSFEVANAAVMYKARRVVAEFARASGELEEEIEAIKEEDVKASWVEEWADGFAYCTWNGIGQALTEEKIFDALDELERNGIKISSLIIDDNWQSLDNAGLNQIYRGMTRFQANEEGFPKGLGHTVHTLREKHKSIRHVAVWHAMLGYWGAIAPKSEIALNYLTVEVKNVNGGTWTCIHPGEALRFYSDFYQFLSDCGIDSVKTDAQFMLDQIATAPSRRALIRPYQDAWTIATLRKFQARAISCMSQAPPLIFHSQMPVTKPRLLVRNSDDFFPDIPSSHAWHVFANAHNALFTQHLHALPDWDMFQTDHPWAAFHAAARCVSGGPIYFTDTPGRHNVPLIKQMTATTPRGETVILRPHRVAKATTPYVGYGDAQLLTVDNWIDGYAGSPGTPLLGVFNVSQDPVSAVLTLADFPGASAEGEYVLRSHVADKLVGPTTRAGKAVVSLDLPVRGYDLLTAYPVTRAKAKSGPLGVAVLGLVAKMSAAAGVVGTRVSESNGRVHVWTSLKALGVLGIWISGLAGRSVEEDLMGVLFGRPIPRHCVSVDGDVLLVDLERAWKESEQRAGWSNEVVVEVFVR